MRKVILVLVLLFISPVVASAEVLIVADEIPAMQVLAAQLKAGEGIESRIVVQKEMPPELSTYSAVIVYIHGALAKNAETAFINYTKAGGRLILLHHSISTRKRENQFWTPFVGVTLPYGALSDGGYAYFEGVKLQIVNLAPSSFITSRKMKWDGQTSWRGPREKAARERSAFTLPDTEVYLNHVITAPAKSLLGFKYLDAKTGKTYMESTAGWYRQSGKGWIFYFMPGHTAEEFREPMYAQMILNAVVWEPSDERR
jgi:hypothetical protein